MNCILSVIFPVQSLIIKISACFTVEIEERPNRITKFISGDDLEDDFMTVTTSGDDKDKSVKSKNKQGVKVVNFVG